MLARALLAQPTGGATLLWFWVASQDACCRSLRANCDGQHRESYADHVSEGCVSGGEVAERTADQPASVLSESSWRQREPPTHRAQPSSRLMRR